MVRPAASRVSVTNRLISLPRLLNLTRTTRRSCFTRFRSTNRLATNLPTVWVTLLRGALSAPASSLIVIGSCRPRTARARSSVWEHSGSDMSCGRRCGIRRSAITSTCAMNSRVSFCNKARLDCSSTILFNTTIVRTSKDLDHENTPKNLPSGFRLGICFDRVRPNNLRPNRWHALGGHLGFGATTASRGRTSARGCDTCAQHSACRGCTGASVHAASERFQQSNCAYDRARQHWRKTPARAAFKRLWGDATGGGRGAHRDSR